MKVSKIAALFVYKQQTLPKGTSEGTETWDPTKGWKQSFLFFKAASSFASQAVIMWQNTSCQQLMYQECQVT